MMELNRVLLIITMATLVSTAALAANEGTAAWWKFDGTPTDSAANIEDALNGYADYVEGVSGKCLKFDGFTTYLKRKADDAPKLSNSFTIEAWVALQVYPWNWTAIADQEKDHEQGYFFGIDALGHVGLGIAVNGKWHQCVSETKLPLLKWSHVVGVFDKTRGLAVFVNGEQVATASVKGSMTAPTNVDLLIGRSHQKMYPLFTEREPSRRLLSDMTFDGLIDEVRIYDTALPAERIGKIYSSTKPQKEQPLDWRRFPALPARPGRFRGYYCRLNYAPEWERLWRTAQHPDILVRFDKSPVKMVFWRGTNYGACWVTENNIWMGDQSLEGGTEWGCAEHMSDKQSRYSSVRILENHPARIVVHWRYALPDIRYQIANTNPETGWGDWADEYYYIYPDIVATRQQILWTNKLDHEWQETIVLNQPGTRPEDNIEIEAMTLANMDGDYYTYSWAHGAPKFDKVKNANIQITNLKAKNKPFIIFEPGGDRVITPFTGAIRPAWSHFPWWNHWPVAQLPNDGRCVSGPDRPASSSLSHGIQHSTAIVHKDNCYIAVSLYGMTQEPITGILPLAKSWINPAKLEVLSPGHTSEGYDKYQRAYVLKGQKGKSAVLRVRLLASEDSPLVNPVFVIKDWGDIEASMRVNTKRIRPRRDFRFGHRYRVEGTDLVVWLNLQSTKPVQVSILQMWRGFKSP